MVPAYPHQRVHHSTCKYLTVFPVKPLVLDFDDLTTFQLPPPSPCQRLTSLPIWLVQRDLEFAAMKLMSPEVYRDFITNAPSRRKFRDYLIKEGTVGTLDCEWDGKVVEELAGQIRSASQNLYGKFFEMLSPCAICSRKCIRRRLY